MPSQTIRILAATALVVLCAGAALAQPAAERIAGVVDSFDGHVLTVQSGRLGAVKVNLADDTTVLGMRKATVSDIKPNDYVGVGAVPLPDGRQRAVLVTIFAESQRGVGEGHYPWESHPDNTMTNGAVDETVQSVVGQNIIVKYKGGEQKIVVPADAEIRAYVPGDKSGLKPGTHVAIPRAVKQTDGSFAANRVNVGLGDMVP